MEQAANHHPYSITFLLFYRMVQWKTFKALEIGKQKQFKIVQRISWEASQEDNLETMKCIYEFIRENGLETYNYLYCGVESATNNRNIKMLKWLKEKKCPWVEDTLYFATKHKSLENIKWRKKNACPGSDYEPRFNFLRELTMKKLF